MLIKDLGASMLFERMSPGNIVKEWRRERERGGKPIKDEQVTPGVTGSVPLGSL